jgi:O-methyltransferase
MRRVFIGILKRLAYAFSVPVILLDYFHPATGTEYGVGFFTKVKLMWTMARNYRRITTGSRVIEHLVMATQILRVPKSIQGCVMECGSFKGGSATNLSLVCALCSRELEIFDSFAGLPEPSAIDKEHMLVGIDEVHTYSKGAWSGTLEEVRQNIARYGRVELCSFHAGYFAETLPSFRKQVVFVFIDVDLRDSLETCLSYLWPLLQDACYVFTHEAQHMEIASLFFSEHWWRSNLRCKPPGLMGAGTGLGLLPARGGFRSDLAYTVKNPDVAAFRINPQKGVS